MHNLETYTSFTESVLLKKNFEQMSVLDLELLRKNLTELLEEIPQDCTAETYTEFCKLITERKMFPR